MCCLQRISPIAALHLAMLLQQCVTAIICRRLAAAAAAAQQHRGDVRRAGRRGREYLSCNFWSTCRAIYCLQYCTTVGGVIGCVWWVCYFDGITVTIAGTAQHHRLDSRSIKSKTWVFAILLTCGLKYGAMKIGDSSAIYQAQPDRGHVVVWHIHRSCHCILVFHRYIYKPNQFIKPQSERSSL